MVVLLLTPRPKMPKKWLKEKPVPQGQPCHSQAWVCLTEVLNRPLEDLMWEHVFRWATLTACTHHNLPGGFRSVFTAGAEPKVFSDIWYQQINDKKLVQWRCPLCNGTANHFTSQKMTTKSIAKNSCQTTRQTKKLGESHWAPFPGDLVTIRAIHTQEFAWRE